MQRIWKAATCHAQLAALVNIGRYSKERGQPLIQRSFAASMADNPDPKQAKSILEFKAVDIDGNDVALSKYEGFVTYIVNVASQ